MVKQPEIEIHDILTLRIAELNKLLESRANLWRAPFAEPPEDVKAIREQIDEVIKAVSKSIIEIAKNCNSGAISVVKIPDYKTKKI